MSKDFKPKDFADLADEIREDLASLSYFQEEEKPKLPPYTNGDHVTWGEALWVVEQIFAAGGLLGGPDYAAALKWVMGKRWPSDRAYPPSGEVEGPLNEMEVIAWAAR